MLQKSSVIFPILNKSTIGAAAWKFTHTSVISYQKPAVKILFRFLLTYTNKDLSEIQNS
jgi:hypothetical protein